MAVVAPVNQLGTGYFNFLVDGVGEGRRRGENEMREEKEQLLRMVQSTSIMKSFLLEVLIDKLPKKLSFEDYTHHF